MSIDNLKEIAKNIANQDDAATREPLYCVYSKRAVPVDEDIGGFNVRPIWIDADDCQEVDSELSDALDLISNGYEEVEILVDGSRYIYERKFVAVIPVFETACLTRVGAENYLKENGHNLREPYIYIHSLNRNNEMIGLRDYILSVNGGGL